MCKPVFATVLKYAYLTLSPATLNHAESTGNQKTSSMGLPTEYSSSFLYFRDPSRFSPPFGTLNCPKFSSVDDSFNDLNFWKNQNQNSRGLVK